MINFQKLLIVLHPMNSHQQVFQNFHPRLVFHHQDQRFQQIVESALNVLPVLMRK